MIVISISHEYYSNENYQQLKSQLLKDKDIKKTYDALGPTFELIEMLIKKRLKRA